MARLLEHDVKRLLQTRGIAVPRGAAARSVQEAGQFAAELGSAVVVKALVPANRRGRSGGVRIVADPTEATSAAEELLGSSFLGSKVDQVLVEERLELERELFLSIVLDGNRGAPVVLASRHGGVDVEATFEDPQHAPSTLELHPLGENLPFAFRQLWRSAGLGGRELVAAADATSRAVRAFFELDATMLELNPLALVAGQAVAIGALMAIDDAALQRHPDLVSLVVDGELARLPTALEQEAAAVAAIDPYRGTARFIELEGDIALLVGGGGGSLVFFDAVRRAGGRPACYTEIGGNPTAAKVRGLTRVALSCRGVRGLLVGHNITNNTQVDLVAEGVVGALADLDIDPRRFPVVARELGTHDEEGRRIFEEAGIECLSEEWTMEDAARRIVERVRGSAT
jgi:succinyl-CoA synthetase beta subunit